MLLDPRGTGGSTQPARPARLRDRGLRRRPRGAPGASRPRAPATCSGTRTAAWSRSPMRPRHPERVERLVLASTLARFSPEQEAAMEAAVEQARRRAVVRRRPRRARGGAGRTTSSSDEELGALVAARVPLLLRALRRRRARVPRHAPRTRSERRRAAALQQGDLRRPSTCGPTSSRITAPTLVITGEDDFITGPPCAAEIAEGIAERERGAAPRDRPLRLRRGSRDAFREAVLAFLGVGARA